MAKRRISATVDVGVYHDVKNDEASNTSALINRLLRAWYDGLDDTRSVILRQRHDRLETEIYECQRRLTELRGKRDRIDEQLGTFEQEQRDVIEEAKQTIGPRDNPKNPAVVNWAGKADMDPADFVEALKNGH